MTKNKEKSYPIFARTITIYALVILLAAGLIYMQFRKYEKGILDVCATQQDGYVQLVLDQINLKDNRSDSEIIRDILGTLDASNNKYWTFARGESMLFVKDVLETNKYQSLGISDYFKSGEAKAFIEGLSLNRVVHREITIDGEHYIASGTSFEYQNTGYSLCLLTNRSVLLDNNKYLEAKVEIAAVCIILAMFSLISAGRLAHKIRGFQIISDQQTQTSNELQKQVESLNKRITNSKVYAPENRLWGASTLPLFLEKLPAKDIWPLSALLIECQSPVEKDALAHELNVLWDDTLNFNIDSNKLLALIMKQEPSAATDLARRLMPDGAFIQKGQYAANKEEYSAGKILSMLNTEE